MFSDQSIYPHVLTCTQVCLNHRVPYIWFLYPFIFNLDLLIYLAYLSVLNPHLHWWLHINTYLTCQLWIDYNLLTNERCVGCKQCVAVVDDAVIYVVKGQPARACVHTPHTHSLTLTLILILTLTLTHSLERRGRERTSLGFLNLWIIMIWDGTCKKRLAPPPHR